MNQNSISSLSPFTRRLFQLPPPTPPISPSHSDLPSFLAYAARTNLPITSTLYQGTHYEYTVQKHLRRAGFSLSRTGGRDDAGIDLQGTWHVAQPVTTPPVRVVVQCKALKSKIGPSVVREVEGVAAARSTSMSTSGFGSGTRVRPRVAGVLVSPREATRGVREALGRSSIPLVWMMVGRDGVLRQVLWNARVQEELGMVGLGVQVRYSLGSRGKERENEEEGEEGEEVGLTWDGEEVMGMDEVEEEMRRVERRWMEKWTEYGLEGRSGEEVLDAVEKLVPGTRPLMLSEEERAVVVKNLLDSRV